jgi:hypothetical protein
MSFSSKAAAASCLQATAYKQPVFKPTMRARPSGVTATQVHRGLFANPIFIAI